MTSVSQVIVLKTGPGTSIQDLGRVGFSKYGVPISGVMDARSMLWVNHMLQNDPNSAVLEISQPGLILQFESPTVISLAGATAKITINNQEIQGQTLIKIKANDQLEIGAFQTGARLYLGIKRGFQTALRMGSRSFYPGITALHHFAKGSKIPYYAEHHPTSMPNSAAKWSSDWYQDHLLTAYPGPDFKRLSRSVLDALFERSYQYSPMSNRMGTQLVELLENDLPELPTNPVFPGTVQLTSGGKLIILGQDAQVTGGYPRILQLTEESRWILAQKKPGQLVRFVKKQG
jgi:biotin-dependent carboxylase-like uncharacterized protein